MLFSAHEEFRTRLGTRMTVRPSPNRMPTSTPAKTTPPAMREARLNYAAVQPSKFRRDRPDIGGTADAHYRILDLWKMREQARDMDRNDMLIGQMLDRATQNVLGTGFALDPDTGDDGLNTEISERWKDWAEDPRQCDRARRHPFCVLEFLALRHTLIDGDIFSILTDDGSVQLVEGDRVESPFNQLDDVIHGVELDPAGAPQRYWFVRMLPHERERRRRFSIPSSPEAYQKIPAVDGEGRPIVLHVYDPKRATQTRGVTALKSVLDVSGMIEDVNFAELVKRQVSACIAAFIRRTEGADLQFGARTQETSGLTVTDFEELQPGLVARLRPGEDVVGYTPTITTGDARDHMMFLIRILGANLGVPLSIALLNTAETTFHGYRGELEQARLGFRWIQRWLRVRWHAPIYRWKVREWFPERAEDPRLVKHRWQAPGWPYVDPIKDAQADDLAIKGVLNSPRGVLAARGLDYQDVCQAWIEDRALLIHKAQEAAADLPEPIDWRELVNVAAGAGFLPGTIPTPVEENPDVGTPAPGDAPGDTGDVP